ncbi:MAG: hypothetical protein IJY39_10775 [Clostridia bacterium]|nr:hypothetical protein [Clostridia bacterium]
MKKSKLSSIAMILSFAMLIPTLASCGNGDNVKESDTEETIVQTESETQTDGLASGSETVDTTETEKIEIVTEEDTTPMLNCDNAELIEYAERIANGVNYYYPNAKRESAVLVNKEMSMSYSLTENGNKTVSYLKNAGGASYVENTMDIFVRMKSGETYYASNSGTDANSNLYRFGFYYYQARYEGQSFINANNVSAEKVVNHLKTSTMNNTEKVSIENNELVIKLTSTNDPFACFGDVRCSTEDYNMLQVTMKADTTIRSAQIYIIAGSKSGFNSEQSYKFNLMADGNYHTYLIPLFLINDYTGNMKGLRFDIDGSAGSTYTIKEMKLVKADVEGVPANISIARTFNVYSDKMHHVLQVSATKQQNDIAEIGMLTEIPASTVEKLIVKDKNGLHEDLDGIDWASAEYIAFDIKKAGIFGYILPADNNSGSIKVTLSEGVYCIEQTKSPKDGTILPSEKGTNNANDFYMGQRIYTDPTHTFERFLAEAEEERHPLTDKNFVIDTKNSAQASFGGYDALRGIYVLNYQGIGGGNNKYPNVKFEVTGDKSDRKIYVMAYSPVGTVEGAAVLDDKSMVLPIPIEIGKNFSEAAGERNLYNIDDPVYSEAIIPLVVNAEETYGYNILNFYQYWGRFPLKQISWIQFWSPYYHLSTALTETNCICPYYTTRNSRNINTLPDFRSMSAPPFSGQQKNSGGSHYFLQYTEAEGNHYTSESTYNTIGSFGMTYADVTMGYLSDDGKIKITYNHMEMPQTDENRTYYEMTYEILEDISFKDFGKDFSFYSVRSNDPTGVYTLVGYLGEGDQFKVTDAKKAGDNAAYYTLGKTAPYFSYMKMTEDRGNKSGYINLAFLVADSEFIIGGEKVDPSFLLTDHGGLLSISLDLDEVTLKAGDKFTINCILLPWGSQETVYDGSNGKAPDQNVRDVRENTILDPHKATANKDCEVIETVYVPMLRTTNGKSAEFTLSGGHNNVAVRIYGFNMLTVPQIYEYVNGQWVEYEVSSAKKPDSAGNRHEFDGYSVFYDGDGTFSYSFIATMDNGAERKFKIVADTPFEGWKGISADPEDKDPIDILVDHNELYTAAQSATNFGKIEHFEEDGFVRFYTNATGESYFKVFGSNIETGHYLVLKYRMPKNNPSKVNTFEFYTSTTEQGAAGSNSFWSSGTLVTDGEWHVLVINLALRNNASFSASSDGKYYAKFLRLDLFNQKLNEGTYIDLEYVGMSNSLDEIKEINADMQVIQLSEEKSSYKEISVSGEDLTVEYIKDGCGYTYSEKAYVCCIDAVNSVSGAYAISSVGINSITYGNVITSTALSFGGWAVVEGGVDKYLWSADGGATWHEVTSATLKSCSDAMVNKANEKIGGAFSFSAADKTNGGFQGLGIKIDLSAYKGQSVNVILAAVPAGETDKLCILSYVTDVTVQ